MKFYTLDTEFTFGKYEGKTVKEVLELQPTYLDWCAVNLDHFYISDETITEIKKIKPDFTITEEGEKNLLTNILPGKTNNSRTIMMIMTVTVDENLMDNMQAHMHKTLKG
jgi:hypothetical protein